MSKSKNLTAAVETVENNNEVVSTEISQTPEAPKTPEIKVTPVEERKYELKVKDGEPMKFRGKQRQIVYDVLKTATEPLTISQVAKLAEPAGLKAVGGVEPSVRYHLHHMTNDGFTSVANPTITIE